MSALYTRDDYREALLALLPRGRAWSKDPGGLMFATMAGLAISLERLDARAQQLLIDAFPATTVELLPEWEASLGLPDPCTGTDPTIEQRQAQVVARLTDSGGQDPQHFTDFAADLGFTITISYFKPWRCGHSSCEEPLYDEQWLFAWQVNAPLVNLQPNDVLECEIRARAPAHTVVLFSYGEPGQLDFSLDNGRNTAWLGII